MVNWRWESENEEDGKRKWAEGGQHLTGNVSFPSTEADMAFANKVEKYTVVDVDEHCSEFHIRPSVKQLMNKCLQ